MNSQNFNCTLEQHKEFTAANRVFIAGAILIVLAFILRLAYVNTLIIVNPIRNDAQQYFHLAYNLVYHHHYSLSNSAPFISSTYITPGYPLFLASGISLFDDFDSFYSFILNIQALLGSVTVALIYLTAARTMPFPFAFLAGALGAVSPHLVAASGYFLTETLFTFLLAATIFLSILSFEHKKIWLFVLTGTVCGLASLVRPVLLLYPVIILAILWRFMPWRLGCRCACVMLASMTLVWLPWQIWKTAHFNASEPSLAPASFAMGTYPNLIYKNPQLRGYPYRDGDPEWIELSSSFTQALPIFFHRVKQQPLKYIQWYLLGKPKMYWQANNNVAEAGGPFIYEVEKTIYHKNGVPLYSLMLIMAFHPYLVMLAGLTILMCIYLFTKRINMQDGMAAYLCAAIVLYFTAVHTVLTPLPRYSYPVIPFAYLLACLGIYSAAKYFRNYLLAK